MFIGRLFTFQDIHERNLLEKCKDHRDLVLYAPTGSGKTVLACKFIDDYLDENPDTVVLWLCPGAGSLEKQSQASFDENMTGIASGDVYDFISEPDPKGKVYFINWDKINRSSNTVLREGEERNLMERVSDCHRNHIDILMLIDEEHKYKETASRFENMISPIHVLRISATPTTRNACTEVIEDDEVISAGLIAMNISINEGLAREIENNNNLDDDLLLIKMADDKRKQIIKEYDKLGLKIRPLVLIQFPNGKDEWIARIKSELENLGYPESSGLVASWFSGDHPDNVEEIKKLNGQYAFLLFKQAVATGWDCPRAKILVKLREGGTEAFNVQTVGRIRRMPERCHYDNETLDRCYVYTLDDKYKAGLTTRLLDSFYSIRYVRKTNAPSFVLKKEVMDGDDRTAVNPQEVINVIRQRFLDKCDSNHDGKIDKRDMEIAKGFIFGTILKTTAFEGVARTTKDMTHLNQIFGGQHELNTHDDGFIIRDAKRRIASALNVEENISNNALRILFGPIDKDFDLLSQEEIDFEKEHKLISNMSLREYDAFLINNREKIIEILSDIKINEIAEIVEANIVLKDWSIPPEQYYLQHKLIEPSHIYDKNVFKDYGDNIVIDPNRSRTEILFEDWCDDHKVVKWIYKNGDKGDEYFSIVYRKGFRRANFYPDYIIQLKNGDIWIIEAKGGERGTGVSNNIDTYAKNKFDALKEYASHHKELKFGFVRYVGSHLYMSTTEWEENMSNSRTWVPIKTVLEYE